MHSRSPWIEVIRNSFCPKSFLSPLTSMNTQFSGSICRNDTADYILRNVPWDRLEIYQGIGFLYVAVWTISVMDKLILVPTKVKGEDICWNPLAFQAFSVFSSFIPRITRVLLIFLFIWSSTCVCFSSLLFFYNHGRNILRLFGILLNFAFATSKMERGY